MSLPDIIAKATSADGGFDAHISDAWLQGRTAYGGLSAALALEAARKVDVDLPPLRSAQLSFIGPVSGDVSVRAQLLRRGKNAAFVSCDIVGEKGLALRGMFVFMSAITSALDHDTTIRPGIPQPEDSRVGEAVPGLKFLDNYNWRWAWPRPEKPEALVSRWIQLKDRDGLDPMVEQLAIGDCLPPAVLPLMPVFGPLSTMTWMLNILTPEPQTRDGWWLTKATSDYARQGSCSHDMRIWNTDGTLVATGMQSIALFS